MAEPVQTTPADDKTVDVTHQPEASNPPVEGGDQAPNPVETLAKEMGWNPDFNGDGAVDAVTFIRRGRDIQSNLSKTVRNLRRELEATQDGIETIKWTMEQANKRETQRLKEQIADLKAQRKKAVTDGDGDLVDAFDNRIQALEDAAKPADPPPPPSRTPDANPEYTEWAQVNPWYEADAELRQYANNLGELPEMKALPYTRRLKTIADRVKSMYPDKFPKKQPVEPSPANNAQPPSAAVAPVSPSRQRAKPSASRKATAADLSPQEASAGNKFVQLGMFKDLDEYAVKLQERELAMQAAGRR